MDISYTKEQEEYRLKAREWIRENLPINEICSSDSLVNEKLEWEKKLYLGRYAGITWPKEYGGQGLDQVYQIIFNEECGKLGAPTILNNIGKNIIGPTLLELGTEEQKRRFIPKILTADEIWCQGFSEPNAGSDLASLSTKAELVGDKWIITGQKIWTSWAEYAQYCILLARTDIKAPKHKGITFFLVPMDTKGITIRPLKQMTGEDDDFSEVFFDNVEINVDSVVGDVNDGWKVAMRALSYERGNTILEKQARFHKELVDLVHLAKKLKVSDDSDVITNNTYYRQKIAQAFIEVEILKYMGLKITNKVINNQKISTETSVLKLYWSEYHQRFGDLAMDILGREGPFWKGDGLVNGKFQDIFMRSRAETIFAGSSQIQKNIIAERILGMAK